MKAGVAGDPIAHSLSPVLHRAACASIGVECDYQRYQTNREQLPDLLARLDHGWAGLSLTMPLKQVVIPRLDMVDSLAKTVGAVNTVCVQPMGDSQMLVGFNTDVEGIVRAVREVRGDSPVRSALILGSRATASSALAACVQLGAKENLTLAARSHGGPGSALAAATRMHLSPTLKKLDVPLLAEQVQHCDVLISTLPAGVGDALADGLHGDLSGLTVLDVVYSPWPSALVAKAQSLGAKIVPGYLMLLHQAVGQVRLFTNVTPDVEVMRTALLDALS